MAVRSGVGANVTRRWAMEAFPPSTAILDLGCGSGMPIAQALVDAGFAVWGIDAPPSLLSAYRANLPDRPACCEPVQGSDFFGRRLAGGGVAIGLIVLLSEADQRKLLARVANALEPGGRFLFSAPRERCEWRDSLTGRESRSLGAAACAARLGERGQTTLIFGRSRMETVTRQAGFPGFPLRPSPLCDSHHVRIPFR